MWITWDAHDETRHIRVGVGPELYTAELLDYRDDVGSFPITGIGFATAGSDPGGWAFKDNVGESNVMVYSVREFLMGKSIMLCCQPGDLLTCKISVTYLGPVHKSNVKLNRNGSETRSADEF